MKCFEVIINGERVCTAGVGDDGVLTGIVSFVKRSHSSEAQDDRDSESLDLRIGGLANRGSATEHLEWLDRKLAVGDEITIKIIEAAECDEPNRKEVDSVPTCRGVIKSGYATKGRSQVDRKRDWR